MKKIALLILFILISISNSHAFDKWTDEEVNLQLTYTALHFIDWRQTRYIAKHPDTHYEINPILGENPSVGRVDTYSALSLLGHTMITDLLPSKYRKYWQCVTIGIKSAFVYGNYRVDIKIEF